MTCNIDPHILRYLEMVEKGEIEACEEQHLLCKLVRNAFSTQDIYTDSEQLKKYLGLSKYFAYEKIFEWEEFCIALHLCTYWSKSKLPRWPDLFLLGGRGLGKDGYIALESFALTSPYNPIRAYDVDICANAEEQAMRPVNDILEVLDDAKNSKKLHKHYYWTKERIKGIKYGGTIRGRTKNPKSKDGMRSGMVVFNEIHQYENYDNIKVFITGLGKKPQPRILYATTNGDVREGPLDDILLRSEEILRGERSDNGLLPFICKLDDKEEAKDPRMWEKANPSLPYLPHLRMEIEKEFELWKQNAEANTDFMTKRMNLPQTASDVPVTSWDNIASTNKPLPDLTGWKCTCGIDYASIGDFASVNLHFRRGDERFDIKHSWLCLRSRDLQRIKAPWQEWAERGLLTPVDDVEIHPDLICEWIFEHGKKYQIAFLGIDNFRYALMTNSLRKIGFDEKDFKNVKLIRTSDIMKTVPVIESVFNNQKFTWGDDPLLRWATNNTKRVRSSKDIGSDTGNFYYAKIEGRSRKTDPFMALVASMVIEDKLETVSGTYYDLPVIFG